MSEVRTIEEILDLAIDKLIGGTDIQDIEKDYPEYAEELRPLLEKVLRLQRVPEPDSKSSVQALMKIAAKISVEDKQEKQAIPGFTPRRFFLRIAASTAILFGLGWGTVFASSNTVPGDWFYPVKLFTEKVRFLLSVNEENKVELRITYSTERLKELVKKYNGGDGLDKELLKSMLDEAKAALDDGRKLNTTTRPLLMERINNLSHLQGKTLKKWKKEADPADKKILKKSIDTCMERCRKIYGNMPMMKSMTKDGRQMMRNCPMMGE